MATNGTTDPSAPDLPIIYYGWTMGAFKRKVILPPHMSHLYKRIYERGMEMSDASGRRMLMVPRHKRRNDPDYISAKDLDDLAERPE